MDKTLYFICLFLSIFGNFIYYFFRIDILGYSLFSILIPASLGGLLFIYYNHSKDKIVFNSIILISTLVAILLIRNKAFNEPFINRYIGSWFVLVPCIYFYLRTHSLRIFYWCLGIFIVAHSITSILFILELPTLEMVSEDDVLSGKRTRFRGLLGGSNVLASGLVIAFVMFTKLTYFGKNHSNIIIVLMFLITLIGVLPTGSRLGLIILILFMLIYIMPKLSKFYIYSVIVLPFIFYKSILEIFKETRLFTMGIIDQSRIEKYTFAFEGILSNVTHILIGLPSSLQSDRYINISDNSFILLLVRFGLPFTLLFSFILIKPIITISLRYKSDFYLLFIIPIFMINNTLLHFPLIVMLFTGIRYVHLMNISNHENDIIFGKS